MAFYAHERNGPDGETVRQTVYEHLRGTARRAAECLRAAGLENAGSLAGLLHDMQNCPKATPPKHPSRRTLRPMTYTPNLVAVSD